MEGGRRAVHEAVSGPRVSREIDQALEAASDWVARLQNGDAEDAVAFDAWLEASEVHRRAYDRALAVWTEYQAAAPQVLAELPAQAVRNARATARRPAWLIAGALAAAAAAAAVGLGWPQLRPTDAPASVYVTGVGQHTAVRLADGTRIDLNAGTRLAVAYAGDARRVTLTEGEAIFDVAHDPARPFLITAGDRTIAVLGTRFDVRRRQGELAVTVARGLVEVRPSGGADGRAFRLHPGQRLQHHEGQAAAEIGAPAPGEAFDWREGRLVFQDRPLGEVVEELNLQFRRPIRLEDARLAERRVSGVLVLDDEDAVVRRLALLAPVRPIGSRDGVLLRSGGGR